ncbi:RNA exonuclease [Saccharomyces cerevisiae RM11-1a]|uniref:RNA exonuclease n=1 Tax=Saccharomyces cerevisiae (strain RM11-1a) TaxID=285006 RepID=B3LT30_YEAS1|nr:Rex2p [Saccharomyces cerevisiae YJM1250]AJV69433.1 Rex2p [Saccharomyces cerevisiae YJM1527]EDV09365.1 RNA exonuclease [Saccharomyces cerevisiae RM11-1a]CAI4639981.1 AEH_G0035890.mRNA.1.CDS.1 [Saccharomyces cerevisiae]CAI6797836.1 AEH_G0035890.mRNA.1.CDS.1 [Saccharomyces cerevisiae]
MKWLLFPARIVARTRPNFFSLYRRSVSQYLRPRTIQNLQSMAQTPELKTKLFKPLVWIDCEMTGLDHVNDRIIEICCIITDGHLAPVKAADGQGDSHYESVIHYGPEVMNKMNEWCIEHHGNSGLTAKVLASEKTLAQVEDELLEYIQRYIPDKNVGVLAGNSVHMDRLFMVREFPKVIDHLFYRIVDVSSIMEVARRHNPALQARNPKKEAAHTAYSDIKESIAQLQWYMDNYLKPPQETESVESIGSEQPESPSSSTSYFKRQRTDF